MAGRQAYGQGRMGGMGMGQANGRMGWQGGNQGGPMPGPFMPGMGGPGMGMGMGRPGMAMGMGMPMAGPPMPFMPPAMGMQGIVSRLLNQGSALSALLNGQMISTIRPCCCLCIVS